MLCAIEVLFVCLLLDRGEFEAAGPLPLFFDGGLLFRCVEAAVASVVSGVVAAVLSCFVQGAGSSMLIC